MLFQYSISSLILKQHEHMTAARSVEATDDDHDDDDDDDDEN